MIKNPMDKQPSLIKILTVDYLAFMAVIMPVVFWGVYLFMLFTDRANPSDLVLPVIFGAVTLVALIVLAWRITLINGIFRDGFEVPATIVGIFFYRDRGRITFTYTYQGQQLKGGNAVHKVRSTQMLAKGDEVTVLLDRSHPRRAFIRDLFI